MAFMRATPGGGGGSLFPKPGYALVGAGNNYYRMVYSYMALPSFSFGIYAYTGGMILVSRENYSRISVLSSTGVTIVSYCEFDKDGELINQGLLDGGGGAATITFSANAEYILVFLGCGGASGTGTATLSYQQKGA